jgi:hydrophobic/amphiphilic exporter-1 (mainly G- bacteria), HAE1 family
MQWLVEICVRRPVFSVVLMLVLVVVGGAAYTRLGLEQLPNVDIPIVVVSTALPGAAPAEVETEISDKIESAVNTLGGIEELRSTSSEGLSQVIISFDLDKDLDSAAQDVRDKVQSVIADLPQGIEQPIVSKLDLNAAPVLLLALRAERSSKELTEAADNLIRRPIESINGVGQVALVGARKRQVSLWMDPLAMRASNVTSLDIERAIGSQNLASPGGTLELGPERQSVRIGGRVRNLSELGRVVVKQEGDHKVFLEDVARTEDTASEARSLARFNGQEVVLISVRKQSGKNVVAVVDAVKAELEALRKDLPPDMKLDLVNDTSLTVRTAVHSVMEHLILGSILAALVVLVFLGNLRSTLIAALAIPISIIGTFAVMWWQGLSLNILTLLALALAVGIVIDDAIVVLENILKMMEEKKAKPFVAAVLATKEISLPVIATTLSLLAVFLPVAFMGGIVGRFLKSFGLTMAFAIAISMFVSFTLTPSLSARLLRLSTSHRKNVLERMVDAFYRPIEVTYIRLLAWSMHHRWVIVMLSLGTLFALVPLAGSLPSSFVPSDDLAQFDVNIRAKEGASLPETKLVAERLEHALTRLPGVRGTLLTVAGDEAQTQNSAKLNVLLTDPKARALTQEKIMDMARKEIAAHPEEGVRATVAESSTTGEATQTVQYTFRGPEIMKLTALAEQVTEELRKSSSAVDVESTALRGSSETRIDVDRDRAQALGVSVSDISEVIRTMLSGKKVSTYVERGETYDVRLRADRAFRSDPNALHLVSVPSSTQGVVPLDSVVKFEASTAAPQIKRLGRQKEVTVLANAAPGAGDSAVETALLAAVKGYSVVPAGNSKELGRTAAAFGFAFLLSFIFMYLVLAAQFESWIHPITILITLPLTATFGLLSLKIFGQGINLFTALGILVLFGVVKKNAILQIDHTLGLRARGIHRNVAILDANRDRLRPILMTTVAFVAGMLPLLFSKGVGAAQSQSTAGIILGGQVLSLLLTLLAVPVFYSLFDDVAAWVQKKFPRAEVDTGERELDALTQGQRTRVNPEASTSP